MEEKRKVTIEDLDDFFERVDRLDFEIDKIFQLELWDLYKKIFNLYE
ncbi:MAG: hypothetical protein ACOCVF_03090 [bacterium]